MSRAARASLQGHPNASDYKTGAGSGRQPTQGTAPSLFDPPRKLTLAERYTLWRRTKEGDMVFREIEARCMEEARLDARRISIARHVEQIRLERKWTVNQNHRAFISRELCECHPSLWVLIETRGGK